MLFISVFFSVGMWASPQGGAVQQVLLLLPCQSCLHISRVTKVRGPVGMWVSPQGGVAEGFVNVTGAGGL